MKSLLGADGIHELGAKYLIIGFEHTLATWQWTIMSWLVIRAKRLDCKPKDRAEIACFPWHSRPEQFWVHKTWLSPRFGQENILLTTFVYFPSQNGFSPESLQVGWAPWTNRHLHLEGDHALGKSWSLSDSWEGADVWVDGLLVYLDNEWCYH